MKGPIRLIVGAGGDEEPGINKRVIGFVNLAAVPGVQARANTIGVFVRRAHRYRAVHAPRQTTLTGIVLQPEESAAGNRGAGAPSRHPKIPVRPQIRTSLRKASAE
jgi:hypothetical protein